MLRAPSQPETSNSPVCLRGKGEREREGRASGMESAGVLCTAAAKVPVQVVSPRVYDNRTPEARDARSTWYPRTYRSRN